MKDMDPSDPGLNTIWSENFRTSEIRSSLICFVVMAIAIAQLSFRSEVIAPIFFSLIFLMSLEI